MQSELALSPIVLAAGISSEFLRYHRMCPIGDSPDGALIVATCDGMVADGLEDLAVAYGRPVTATPVGADDLEELIARIAPDVDRTVELSAAEDATDSDDVMADVRGLAEQPPVVRYVNSLVRDACDDRASDIHLEANREGLTARFRVDGVLVPAANPPATLQHAVVSRIKLLAQLDIAERRRPQDGRLRVRLDERELDIRVSTVPTMFGESVVLRLLDQGGATVNLDDLGMSAESLSTLTSLIERPHGMILVTGPTGSGKTTTLYAALRRRRAHAEKIITVEDPVEYQIQGITQVPVQRAAGVTFSSALRAILRQDPDVVMVGETRDAETAEIAVQAAMTGHLVLTTLHTNDAVTAVARLLDLGVPDYLITATLEGIVAQRLVRRICDGCRVPYEADGKVLTALAGKLVKNTALSRGAGCPACRGTGYRGRVGLFELLVMTDAVRDAISTRVPRTQLREIAASEGMTPLRADGLRKIMAGLTTVEEVLRVAQA